MTIALARFPGSNCDRDVMHVLSQVLQTDCAWAWHDNAELPPGTRAVVIPGGFSYGDYLRCGAMAAHRPLMAAIKNFARQGGPVLGICNGFQILCEAGILPGALLPNRHGRFVCKSVELVVGAGGQGILKSYQPNEKITLTIAHHDGNYFADKETLQKLKTNHQIALQYVELDAQGDASVNGSLRGIAGILGGPRNNVLGLMPHPERHSEHRLGGDDGLRMLKELMQ